MIFIIILFVCCRFGSNNSAPEIDKKLPFTRKYGEKYAETYFDIYRNAHRTLWKSMGELGGLSKITGGTNSQQWKWFV